MKKGLILLEGDYFTMDWAKTAALSPLHLLTQTLTFLGSGTKTDS
jgi:hypothetical protein